MTQNTTVHVRIPPIMRDKIWLAVALSHQPELTNKDICELFGIPTGNRKKVADMKKMAKEEERAGNVPSWNPLTVNTRCAFRAWGIDIEALKASKAEMDADEFIEIKKEAMRNGRIVDRKLYKTGETV